MPERVFLCVFWAMFLPSTGGYFFVFMWWLGRLMGYRYALGEGPEPVIGCFFLLLSVWLALYTGGIAAIVCNDAMRKVRAYFKEAGDGR